MHFLPLCILKISKMKLCFLFFNCKKQLQNFFLSQYFHLYLPRPGVLLKLAGRFKFGGGGGSEKLSSLCSFFREAGDYRKETWGRGQLSFALRRRRVSGQDLEAEWSSSALPVAPVILHAEI